MGATCCIYLIPHVVIIVVKTCSEDHKLYSPSSCNCLQSLVTSSQIQTFLAASCSQTPTVCVVSTWETNKITCRIEGLCVFWPTFLDWGNERIFISRCWCFRLEVGRSWSLSVRLHGTPLRFAGRNNTWCSAVGGNSECEAAVFRPVVMCPAVRVT
jgi:hypothetical protein